ncbi:hypothetical protein [Aliarcobacter cryaerophilus]|uniref:hypothetical protein n=1 Tax=Aliarcobacter cryaerophilus TaxID=28198 RepID=UPI003DA50F80
MRTAVITTLKALYESKEVTANKSLECETTRITNEISLLRNDLGIDIITDRVPTKNKKWYGSYRLIRSNENLKRVQEILSIYSKDNFHDGEN